MRIEQSLARWMDMNWRRAIEVDYVRFDESRRSWDIYVEI